MPYCFRTQNFTEMGLSVDDTFYDETPFITKIDKGSGGSRRENIWRMFLKEKRQSV